MAAGKSKFEYDKDYYEKNRTYYTTGSAARKVSLLPRENDEEQEFYPGKQNPAGGTPKRRKAPFERPVARPYARPKVKKVAGIDFVSTAVLAVAIAITFYLCIQYLMVQSDTVQINKKISAINVELLDVLNQNSLLEKQLAESLDLDYIFTVAVEQLGMVYPNNNNVVQYEKPETGYVRQYAPIPQADDEGVLDELMP